MIGDEVELNRIQEKIIKPHPNTYTFTKRLAEIIARDMGKKLPLSIVRPSIDHKLDSYFIKQTYLGIRTYCLKDDGKSRSRYILLNVFFVLDLILQCATLYGLIWLILYLLGQTEILRFSY
ncbi:hypothetical protein Trydic_g11416 [Trypoxylus dichotomus]